MPIVPDGSALRRPLRACAIGALLLLVVLAAWQFLIPGDHSNPLAASAFIVAASVCLSSGVGLTISATRRLWRSRQRGRAVLPAVFLVAVAIAFPSAAGAAGVHWLIWLGSLLLALLVSAVFSAYLILTTKDGAPIPSPPTNRSDILEDAAPVPSPRTDFDADEPHAYVTDIPDKRKTG